MSHTTCGLQLTLCCSDQNDDKWTHFPVKFGSMVAISVYGFKAYRSTYGNVNSVPVIDFYHMLKSLSIKYKLSNNRLLNCVLQHVRASVWFHIFHYTYWNLLPKADIQLALVNAVMNYFGFYKMQGIAWLAENTLASQNGLCSME